VLVTVLLAKTAKEAADPKFTGSGGVADEAAGARAIPPNIANATVVTITSVITDQCRKARTRAERITDVTNRPLSPSYPGRTSSRLRSASFGRPPRLPGGLESPTDGTSRRLGRALVLGLLSCRETPSAPAKKKRATRAPEVRARRARRA
jgi:hypothetical protein